RSLAQPSDCGSYPRSRKRCTRSRNQLRHWHCNPISRLKPCIPAVDSGQKKCNRRPVLSTIFRNKPFGEYVEGLSHCEDASYRSTSVFKSNYTKVELTGEGRNSFVCLAKRGSNPIACFGGGRSLF